ncbi:MAG TPA: nucleotidyltransferase family protein [Acidisarcina sp.]
MTAEAVLEARDAPVAQNQPVAAIVLAAGGSRRLGRPKQLIQKDGESLLRRSARLAVDAGCAPVVVVLGWQAYLMERELAGLAVSIAVNAEWESGMASSLCCGLRAISGQEPESAMVLVCDQPLLTVEALTSLIASHDSENGEGAPDITASSYSGARGVPAIFKKGVFPSLMQLKGDEGARRIISDPLWKVATVEFAGGAVDVDLQTDLLNLY